MVTPQQEEVLGVFQFEEEQQDDCLNRLLPPVHVVSQEEVVLVWGVPSVVEDFEQVLELSMDISHHFYRGLQLQKHRLRQENLTD